MCWCKTTSSSFLFFVLKQLALRFCAERLGVWLCIRSPAVVFFSWASFSSYVAKDIWPVVRSHRDVPAGEKNQTNSGRTRRLFPTRSNSAMDHVDFDARERKIAVTYADTLKTTEIIGANVSSARTVGRCDCGPGWPLWSAVSQSFHAWPIDGATIEPAGCLANEENVGTRRRLVVALWCLVES